jgi:phosphoribosylformylglycinamidine synthase
VVAVLGLIEWLRVPPPGVRLIEGGQLLLLGAPATELGGGSLWALRRHGFKGGTLPALDLVAHVDLLVLVQQLVTDGLVAGLHDVSEGGLGVALGEMAVRSGIGFSVFGVAGAGGLFSEAPSRVVVCVDPSKVDEVTARAGAAGVPVTELGEAGGDRLVVQGLVNVSVADAVAAAEGAIPNALTPATH